MLWARFAERESGAAVTFPPLPLVPNVVSRVPFELSRTTPKTAPLR